MPRFLRPKLAWSRAFSFPRAVGLHPTLLLHATNQFESASPRPRRNVETKSKPWIGARPIDRSSPSTLLASALDTLARRAPAIPPTRLIVAARKSLVGGRNPPRPAARRPIARPVPVVVLPRPRPGQADQRTVELAAPGTRPQPLPVRRSTTRRLPFTLGRSSVAVRQFTTTTTTVAAIAIAIAHPSAVPTLPSASSPDRRLATTASRLVPHPPAASSLTLAARRGSPGGQHRATATPASAAASTGTNRSVLGRRVPRPILESGTPSSATALPLLLLSSCAVVRRRFDDGTREAVTPASRRIRSPPCARGGRLDPASARSLLAPAPRRTSSPSSAACDRPSNPGRPAVATMDRPACHVIYVNRAAGDDGLLQPAPAAAGGYLSGAKHARLREAVKPLLDTFGDVHVCATGEACMSKLAQLQDGSMIDIIPTLILLDTPPDEPEQELASHTRSYDRPDSLCLPDTVALPRVGVELYGLALLQAVIAEARMRNMSKLIVPVPIVGYSDPAVDMPLERMTDGAVDAQAADADADAGLRQLIKSCLDLGATDVLISPLNSRSVTTLEICAYRAHRDAAKDHQALMEMSKSRKRSWVGVNEQKPFAYLREAMVSGLMNGICRLDSDDTQIATAHIVVSPDRQSFIDAAIDDWHFCAHAFSDDELLVASVTMFDHALTAEGLEQWKIDKEQLMRFLVACRAAYNSFVPYHNFRHVVDVLQATFSFLVHIGALPPHASSRQQLRGAMSDKSPMAALGVADVMPAMRYIVDELQKNKTFFKAMVELEKSKSKQPKAEADQMPPMPPMPPTGLCVTVTDSAGGVPRVLAEVTAASNPSPADGHKTNGIAPAPDAARSRHRCGEATEGGASGALAGDWQSQATSATTGKAAPSPSTQGTSIVSNESTEPTVGASPTTVTDNNGSTATVGRPEEQANGEESTEAARARELEGKSLKKKPSRFKMKDFPFFRRNKGPIL
ncbi:hypothetical protein DCS_05331 [Drechmeria coniospora]|uniref:PDEase domain-containing protein n=1 Tax=Drechmeria coniospora TaxID=98403 RepID=A0A151GML6_DRECN|nr:hypothetical protein DCS_05331 [Drechmeria coniospora]KYK58318.1 hypothetical protein DCS_05331 [Drechmeria coniospora]